MPERAFFMPGILLIGADYFVCLQENEAYSCVLETVKDWGKRPVKSITVRVSGKSDLGNSSWRIQRREWVNPRRSSKAYVLIDNTNAIHRLYERR